jgi:glycerol kinase
MCVHGVQADLAQLPVERPHFQETTSLGAALAAGLAIGMFTHDQIFKRPEDDFQTFQPRLPANAIAGKYKSWSKAVERSFDLADLA